MENEKITIDFSFDAPFVIFQEPKIKHALNSLFENMSEIIFERFKSILVAIEVEEKNAFSEKKLLQLFKWLLKIIDIIFLIMSIV